MNGIGKSITLWGGIALAGFGVFEFVKPEPFYPLAVAFWMVLSLVGFYGMKRWVPDWLHNDTVKVWLGIVSFGMVVEILQVYAGVLPFFMPVNQFWLALIGIGYVLTGFTWHKHLYYLGGVLQFALLGVWLAKVEPFQTYSLLSTGVVTALPALYDGLTGYND